jgi:hypothetical protein
MNIMQMVMQGRLISDPSLLTLPHVDHQRAAALSKMGVEVKP